MGNSLMVQWLGLGAFMAEGTGSIPDQGTKILHSAPHGWGKKKKKKLKCLKEAQPRIILVELQYLNSSPIKGKKGNC